MRWSYLPFLCLLVAQAHAAGKVLHVGFHYSAPWAYAGEGGRLQGIDYDIVSRIFEHAGYQIKAEIYSHERLIQKFSDKELDFASPVAVPIAGAYLTVPYFAILDVAVAPANSYVRLDELADLKGLDVVAYQKATEVLGAEYVGIVSGAGYLEMAERDRQFDLLFNHKVQVMVGDEKVLRYYASKRYGEGAIKVFRIFPFKNYPAAAWDKQVVEDFNQGLAKMQASGEYQQLLDMDRP
ncbi:transporter substrate-binding domain-containing protein [Aliiglaciecola sp. CAU 1673]|uniref:substrate-binding periplasmic protein n=1 Tax=Aliiglaciecola sp. CAU 1673 TaxID=3032595 RepID=UPI0023DAE6B5|nr:transporter substrate-binding domain-containing protein [Aliiglaciecola sp. CAU 1673]MDF2178110.1 transporter substrate-binding domain-containing protein [Aliiglaciecola sp. CAU 1673]